MNAWDADAERVNIDIDIQDSRITIRDDGHGMTVADANAKYLTRMDMLDDIDGRRIDTSFSLHGPRPDLIAWHRENVFLGYYLCFAISNTVEVHSVKNDERHGFKMNIDEIRQATS